MTSARISKNAHACMHQGKLEQQNEEEKKKYKRVRCSIASSEIVCADDKESVCVERLSRADKVLPPPWVLVVLQMGEDDETQSESDVRDR